MFHLIAFSAALLNCYIIYAWYNDYKYYKENNYLKCEIDDAKFGIIIFTIQLVLNLILYYILL